MVVRGRGAQKRGGLKEGLGRGRGAAIQTGTDSKHATQPPRTTNNAAPKNNNDSLPCWFALRLLRSSLGRAEALACRAAIPLSLALSAAGFVCSVSTLVRQIRDGGSAFGPPA